MLALQKSPHISFPLRNRSYAAQLNILNRNSREFCQYPSNKSTKTSRINRLVGPIQAILSQRKQSGTEASDKWPASEPFCIFQAFSWTSGDAAASGRTWYETVLEKIDELAELGFSDILLPPCAQSEDSQGYLPSNFYSLDSSYGSKDQLVSVIEKIRHNKMRACGVVVLNRLAGSQPEGHVAWKAAGGTVDEVIDWGDWVQEAGAATSRKVPHVEEKGSESAIDHSDPKVQSDTKGWLNWLRNEIGFDAWCFDLAKMFDPSLVHIYSEASSPSYSMADVWNPMRYNGIALEYNQDQHRQDLVSWVKATRGTAMVLDYTTKGILQQAVQNCEYWRLIDPQGRPPGVIGWLPKQAVTFVDNHTTGSVPRYWPFPNWGVMVGYCYILTHPGTPCVFWDHVYDWKHGDAIKALIMVRKRNGIRANSDVKILVCHPDLYVARVGENVDTSDFSGIIVKIGPTLDMRGSAPGGGWVVCASGRDYSVWERSK